MEVQSNILVTIMSCNQNKHLWKKLLQICPYSIIFCADPNQEEEYVFSDRILSLKCGDTYDCLPMKVFCMINAILEIPDFKNIQYIFKVDDHDTKISANIANTIKQIPNINHTKYGGQRINGAEYRKKSYDTEGIDRTWHFNKCPSNSVWHNKPYEGPYVAWADGGCGYLLSREAMRMITFEPIKNIQHHIYEDVMIALILFDKRIYPRTLPEIIGGDK